MAESPQALQSLDFKDLTQKADGYDKALKGEYEDYDFEFSGGISMAIAIVCCTIGGAATASLAIGIICGLIPGGIFFGVYNTLRRQGARRVLADPEAKYLYRLRQAVEEYNENASLYNQHLLALENGAGQMTSCELQGFHYALEKERQDLQKRIVHQSVGDLPPISLYKVLDKTRELRETEELALLVPSSTRPLLPESTKSSEYSEALAELDEEFPDKD